jgi:glycolate oxidase FAD binding subunit
MSPKLALEEVFSEIAEAGVNGVPGLAPRTNEQAVEVVRYVAEHSLATRLAGRGSSFEDVAPRAVDAIMSSSSYSGIIDYQPDDLTVVVRAGTTVADLDAVLAERDQTAVLPETSPLRTIGGIVSSAASGFRRLRYGPTRDRVLGVTLVTGYGEIVKGGGRLVKNVTGYDLPRLCVGSHGALGYIGDVCLKLWPAKPETRTIEVDDPVPALEHLYQPLAVLETMDGTSAYVEGSEAAVTEAETAVSQSGASGLIWPQPIDCPFVVSVRVPASLTTRGIETIRDLGADAFIAQHGVGLIEAGFTSLDRALLVALRESVAGLNGVVVIIRWPATDPIPDRWGSVPGGVGIQQRLKSLFDPSSVLNAGQLPGGL